MASEQRVADAAPLRCTYTPKHPVNLRQTLAPLSRGVADPTMRWTPEGTWRTAATPLGPATYLLSQRGSAVEAVAWGPGAEWVIAQVPELLGAGDDLEGFDVSSHRFLADAYRRLPGLRLLRTGLVIEMMIAAIIEQKVTGKEARRGWAALVRQFGAVAPGPAPVGMRVAPTAAQWRAIPSWEWHRAGVGPERSRAAVLAAAVAPGLERTLALGRGGPEIQAKLRSVPGVGVWTAAETSQRAHGDADSPSFGDYHIPGLVGWALIGKAVDDDGMLELLSRWPGHRHRVVRLIELSGFEKPRFGPRMTIQDHRGH